MRSDVLAIAIDPLSFDRLLDASFCIGSFVALYYFNVKTATLNHKIFNNSVKDCPLKSVSM